MLEEIFENLASFNGLDSATTSDRDDWNADRADNYTAGSQPDNLLRRISAIELAVETLLRLGTQHNMFTQEQFLAMARTIDAEDGVIDGRRDMGRMTKVCGKCGKSNPATRSACMWCETSMADVKPMTA